jgi:hypothetical protein
MFRATRRSASERQRLSIPVKIVLLLPLCAILVFGIRTAGMYANGGPSGPSSVSRSQAVIWIENIDEPNAQWVITLSRNVKPWLSAGVRCWYQTESRSEYRGLFGCRTTMRSIHTSTVNSFDDVGYVSGSEPSFIFEREFGHDWKAMRHPDFQARVLPSIEAAISDDLFSWAGKETIGPPVLTASIATAGSLIIETEAPADRWELLLKLFSGTVPLWVFLSVCLVVFTFASRERKANRWLAGKCPKCGYPRSSTRDDCAECGLKYERPSHVTWDPKDGKVEV